MLQDLQEVAQPVILAAVGARVSLLVLPVRGDAVFGHLVHLARADLDLDALALRADDARMQRAVAVRPGRRDVVLEPAWHDPVGGLSDPAAGVALFPRHEDNADGQYAGPLAEPPLLALQSIAAPTRPPPT